MNNPRNSIDNKENSSTRTDAFAITKRARKKDSIGWIIWALLFFFINILSIVRLTIIGQFIDDIFFTFLFGWSKYFIYLILFGLYISIYVGIKFVFKKRFILMIFAVWVALCWFITSILFIVSYTTKNTDFVIEKAFSPTIFKDSISAYFSNWKKHSLFGLEDKSFFSTPSGNTYFNPFAGGGFIGAFLSGIFSYTTIFGNLVIVLLYFFIVTVWILTGNPFYLFKPKDKRKYNSLRILSLKNTPRINNKPTKKRKIFRSINFNEESNDFNDKNILYSLRESDFTIKLPSFERTEEFNVYSDFDDSFYKEDNDISNHQFKDNYKQSTIINNSLDDLDSYNNAGYEEVISEYELETNSYEKQNVDIKPMRTPLEEYKALYGDKIAEEPQNIMGNNDERVSEIRRDLEINSKITPFGAGGNTEEILSRKNKKVLEGQMSLDDFIDRSNEERKQQQKIADNFQEYTSPMQEKVRTSIINNTSNFGQTSDLHNSNTLEINNKKAIKKELHINEGYILPSIDLLTEIKDSKDNKVAAENSANLKAQAIDSVFSQFGVKAVVTHKSIGPSITKFEIQPEAGTKVNSITSLENDLKLALANQHVRIEAPIQGKAAVGIEVPNEISSPVSLRSVIENAPMQKGSSKLLFSIGKSVTGELIFGELDKMPHLLVAGSTGSGKSVMINNIIISILMRSKPHEVKFLMIDPKKVELSVYSKLPHLLTPVISDMNLANNALKKVVSEMERRYALFSLQGVKQIDVYNSKIRDIRNKLPYYVVIIDELADLMMIHNKKDVEDSIKRLTQMARAAGIHLILATQRPSIDVITGVIKSNIPTRIAFAVTSQIDSRTILDQGGAEKLIGKGDLLFIPPGSSSLIRAQGSFVSDGDIEKITKYCSSQDIQYFDEEFLNLENEISEGSSSGSSEDQLFNEIKNYVIENQQASTSLIQRKFSIGYNRAARIIDDLEAKGIIGPQNGSKPREVYIKKI